MWRTWSLRLRLLVGQVVVLAIVCVGIGAVTELALYRYLVGQLDVELHDASHRSVRIFSEPSPPVPWRHHQRPYPRPGPGPLFLDAPGQPVGMVAAVIGSNDATVDAGYLTTAGARAALTDTAKAQLGSIPINRTP
ncbi:MAG: two-component sensor histidine kinase, partial [Mycobacterium sp.]